MLGERNQDRRENGGYSFRARSVSGARLGLEPLAKQ